MGNSILERALAHVNSIVHAKRPVRGTLVVVLTTHRQDRGLRLEPLASRALCQHEIHEIILTSDPEAAPGAIVDHIAYLGFVEITQGGLVYVGDRLLIDNEPIGRLVGFDLTHFPNHLNLVVKTDNLRSGGETGLRLEDPVEFCRP